MADLIDQQFGGYRLLRLIGKGGQASVYLGQHLRLQQRLAAIKILHASVSQQDIEAFQQEANTIAALQHPYIVNVLDFDVQQGTPFLVMEYYPDGSLRDRHPRGECVPLPTVVSYVKQVAEALQHAHNHRLIHRDVKSANLLIGRKGEILLSDFGIVAIAHSTSSLDIQNFAGTAPYMAPEQITQHPRRESDQYALAVVVYEWLCGELPFVGTPQEIAIKHLTVEPLSLCQKLPSFSSQVDQVILKALAKEPKERFPSVQEFAAAFELAMQSMLDVSTHKAMYNQETISSSLVFPSIPAQPLRQAFSPIAATLHAVPTVSDTPPAVVRQIQPVPTSSENKAYGARSDVPTNISMNKDTPSAKVAIQGAQKQESPGDVLRRVRRKDIPSTWSVFYSSRSKFITTLLLNGMYDLSFGLSIVVLLGGIFMATLISEQHSQYSQLIGTVIALAGPIYTGSVLAGGIILRRRLNFKKDHFLVLRPAGVVYGITTIRPGINSINNIVNYKDVVGVRVMGKEVRIDWCKKKGRKGSLRLDLSFFESSESLAEMINHAYEEFKASNYVSAP